MISRKTESIQGLAKTIEHSLLHPTVTDSDVYAGCELAREQGIAAVNVKPCDVATARDLLAGSHVPISSVAGFPHGNSCTAIKIEEAIDILELGGDEVEVVVNIGKALGGDWNYIQTEVQKLSEVVTAAGALLTVVLETGYMNSAQIIQLCRICSESGDTMVQLSTGYNFVKQPEGAYKRVESTLQHLRLIQDFSIPALKIKAAGCVDALEDLLLVRSLGAVRVETTATASILYQAVQRNLPNDWKDATTLNREITAGAF